MELLAALLPQSTHLSAEDVIIDAEAAQVTVELTAMAPRCPCPCIASGTPDSGQVS